MTNDNSNLERFSKTPNGEQLWPMGAVTRRTGIGEHTLRAWERRFGFPMPMRLPSGHRRYTAEQVRQLLLINELLRCGYRAGDVVPQPFERLEEMLRECGAPEEDIHEPSPGWLQRALDAVVAFDRDGLKLQLHQTAVTLGIGRFLRDRVEPMLFEVGEAWARGTLQVRHEHFFSEVLEDVLRLLRAPLEEGASGRPVVLTSLPDEQHGLGLHSVALAVVAAGRQIRLLGPRTPPEEIVQMAQAVDAVAVGLSISLYSVSDATLGHITELRRMLPSRIRLWLGGAGAKQLDDLPVNLEVLKSLDDLDRALRGLPD